MFHALLISHFDKNIRNTYIDKLLKTDKIHPLDQLFLSDETIGIAEIRKLTPYVAQKPFQSIFKTIIINGDNLTVEAQQALLKLLEEPPQFVHLIISVSQSEKLLATVLSRVTQIALLPQKNTKDNTDDPMSLFWTELLRQNPITRLKESIAFTQREEAKQWLEKAILFMREQL